jgi:hypothetical protein
MQHLYLSAQHPCLSAQRPPHPFLICTTPLSSYKYTTPLLSYATYLFFAMLHPCLATPHPCLATPHHCFATRLLSYATPYLSYATPLLSNPTPLHYYTTPLFSYATPLLFFIKNYNLPVPRPPERTSKLQKMPSELQNMKFINFCPLLWVIFALLDPDLNPLPD